jgi:oligoendopeptidase F
MKARNFSSSLEATLFSGNVPVEMFHNLIDIFKKNLPLWHRYWRVRRKALGLKTLHSLRRLGAAEYEETQGALRTGSGLDL